MKQVLLPHANQYDPKVVLKYDSNTCVRFLAHTYNLSLDDYKIHMDRVVSPKCEIVLIGSRPRPYCDIDECNTLGEHIRRKRFHSYESQSFVAQMLSVSTETITSWELNRHAPQVHFYPRIIQYLGYCPTFDLAGSTLSKRVKQYLFRKGITQKEFAKEIRIDSATVQRVVENKKVFQKTSSKVLSVITLNNSLQ